MTYTVDMTATRTVLGIGASEPKTTDVGPNTFSFHVDSLDVSSVKKSALNNVSVLTATLTDATEVEVTKVVCVTQVTKNTEGLVRRVISPLE